MISIRRNTTHYRLPLPKLIWGGVFIPLGRWLLLIDLRKKNAPS